LGISSRLPSRQQLAQVYAIIVLLIYSWTILWSFWKLPTWRIFLTAWEIAGALSFSLATVLVESLAVLGIPVLAALCLPRRWFGEVFVARGGALAATALGYMMFVGDRLKYEMEYPKLPLESWLLALPLAAIVLIVYAAGRVTWLRRASEALGERATIFLFLMPPLSIVAILVLVIRALT
jgi:hypothetical protein